MEKKGEREGGKGGMKRISVVDGGNGHDCQILTIPGLLLLRELHLSR